MFFVFLSNNLIFIIPVKENTEIFSFCDEFDKNILEIPIDGE